MVRYRCNEAQCQSVEFKDAECILLTVLTIVNCSEVDRRLTGRIARVGVLILGGSRSYLKTLTDFLPSVGGGGLWELWSWVCGMSAVPLSQCACYDLLTRHIYCSATSNS